MKPSMTVRDWIMSHIPLGEQLAWSVSKALLESDMTVADLAEITGNPIRQVRYTLAHGYDKPGRRWVEEVFNAIDRKPYVTLQRCPPTKPQQEA